MSDTVYTLHTVCRCFKFDYKKLSVILTSALIVLFVFCNLTLQCFLLVMLIIYMNYVKFETFSDSYNFSGTEEHPSKGDELLNLQEGKYKHVLFQT